MKSYILLSERDGKADKLEERMANEESHLRLP